MYSFCCDSDLNWIECKYLLLSMPDSGNRSLITATAARLCKYVLLLASFGFLPIMVLSENDFLWLLPDHQQILFRALLSCEVWLRKDTWRKMTDDSVFVTIESNFFIRQIYFSFPKIGASSPITLLQIDLQQCILSFQSKFLAWSLCMPLHHKLARLLKFIVLH